MDVWKPTWAVHPKETARWLPVEHGEGAEFGGVAKAIHQTASSPARHPGRWDHHFGGQNMMSVFFEHYPLAN